MVYATKSFLFMRHKPIKFPTPFANLTTFLILANGCKKNDVKPESEENALEERSVAAMKERIEKEGQTVILVTNAKATSFLADANGNRISANSVTEETITACNDADGNPILEFDDTYLEENSSSFICGFGYKVKATWKIVMELPLTATGSRGRLRLKNSSRNLSKLVNY